jgi:hypothetical protein
MALGPRALVVIQRPARAACRIHAANALASSLPDVLERQKEFYAWLADYERKWGRKIEPWAYNRAVAMRETPLLYGSRALT